MENLSNSPLRCGQTTKTLLRKRYRELLAALSPQRREGASRSLFSFFLPILSRYDSILSFMNFREEIELLPLNLFLAQKGKLLLPKMEGERLKIYKIENIQRELRRNAWGILEPIPEKCLEVNPMYVDMALVPGICFDTQNHRIGYGKGFYDRFLPLLPSAETVGIGFKEQFISQLPVESTDYRLKKVSLF